MKFYLFSSDCLKALDMTDSMFAYFEEKSRLSFLAGFR